ncbi:MAG: large subunit ribosomal protein L4 [Candidatus Berkelbacteria bacterium Athens1014_28]|uniref:Large ribosomal subunit protein uL4 n=1 Tax=Candidatus Berkelbacteria bacterium Athens1014_28 TaxID=2017145 RepID=A0A554LQY5_9BACT|nr:MAG: large subunit ribosomal protein L4 [Candidatus Berkelbacteria bacterium Athens1014_28]
MKIDFYKLNGERAETVEFPKSLEVEVSDSRVLEYVRYVRNSIRIPSASTKDRSEVSGSGKKPWKQKGTGRARHGSKRSPIWVGGGVAFGPTNKKNYSEKINKRQRSQIISAIIFSAVKNKITAGIINPDFPEAKTKIAFDFLNKLPISGKMMVFTTGDNDNFLKSFQNIAAVTLATPDNIDIITLISADGLIFTKEVLADLALRFERVKKTAEKVLTKAKESK